MRFFVSRRIAGSISTFLVALLLAGCVSHDAVPNDPAKRAEWYLQYAEDRRKEGDYFRMLRDIVSSLESPNGVEAVSSYFRNNPDAIASVTQYLSSKPSLEKLGAFELVTLKDRVLTSGKAIYLLSSAGLLPDAAEIQMGFDTWVKETNKTGEIAWSLKDPLDYMEMLRTPEQQRIMFMRDLESLGSRVEAIDNARVVDEFLDGRFASSDDYLVVAEYLDNAPLPKDALLIFRDKFPDIVNRRLADLSVDVQLRVLPENRLLEEDLKEKLRAASENYNVLRRNEAGARLYIDIEVEQLRQEIEELPERSETLRYADHEVDLFKSALMMPRGASYVYDYKSGGIEVEYGYLITIRKGNEMLMDELVRGRISEKYGRCENQRIVNVFGGVSPASFVANEDMSRKCSGVTSRTSSAEIKERIQDLIISKIASVKPLADRRD